MTDLRALIFDVDGTLADTERDGHRIAFNCAFREADLNWDWSPSLYGELLTISGGKERIRFYLDRYHPEFQPPEEWGDFLGKLHALKTQHYQQLLATGAIPLRLGVKRLLMEARESGIRLAIATTSALPNVTALLQETLDPSWFEVIAAGDIVPAKKPAPDIYYYTLTAMGLVAEDCLVIEDSHHGLQAALGAGLQTIVTVNDYTRSQDFRGASLVIGHLGEPTEPFEVLAGDPSHSTYIDLKLLRHLHDRSTTRSIED